MPSVTKTASTAISDDLRDEALEPDRVAVVPAEPEQLHVADDQADHEGREIARASELVDREVAERDHGHHDRRRRLAPDARAVGRHEHGQRDTRDEPEGRARAARLCAKSPSGPPSVTCPDSTIAATVSASTVAVGIVERRLGDHGLRDLGPQAEPVEERDQDRRIGGGEDGADQERDIESRRRTAAPRRAPRARPRAGRPAAPGGRGRPRCARARAARSRCRRGRG